MLRVRQATCVLQVWVFKKKKLSRLPSTRGLLQKAARNRLHQYGVRTDVGLSGVKPHESPFFAESTSAPHGVAIRLIVLHRVGKRKSRTNERDERPNCLCR